MSTTEVPVIDLEYGARLVGGETNDAREMLRLFKESLSPILSELESAYSAEQWEDFARLIHKLHGGACYCGVPRLRGVSQQLNQQMKQGYSKEVREGFPLLLTEVQAFMQQCKSLGI
jgi:two-component system sensor histidine kinase BarA